MASHEGLTTARETYALTEEQRKVLYLLATGATLDQIAENVKTSQGEKLTFNKVRWIIMKLYTLSKTNSNLSLSLWYVKTYRPSIPYPVGRITLTPRQYGILDLLIQDKSVRQIVSALPALDGKKIGYEMVCLELSKLYDAVGSSNRVYLAVWYQYHYK